MSLDPFGDAPKWQPPDVGDAPPGWVVVTCRHFPDCKDFIVLPTAESAARWLSHHAVNSHPHEPTDRDRRRIAEAQSRR